MTVDMKAKRKIRCEYAAALLQCRPHERRWLRAVIANGGLAYNAGEAIGLRQEAVFGMLRSQRIARAFSAAHQMMCLELEISLTTLRRLRATGRP